MIDYVWRKQSVNSRKHTKGIFNVYKNIYTHVEIQLGYDQKKKKESSSHHNLEVSLTCRLHHVEI